MGSYIGRDTSRPSRTTTTSVSLFSACHSNYLNTKQQGGKSLCRDSQSSRLIDTRTSECWFGKTDRVLAGGRTKHNSLTSYYNCCFPLKASFLLVSVVVVRTLSFLSGNQEEGRNNNELPIHRFVRYGKILVGGDGGGVIPYYASFSSFRAYMQNNVSPAEWMTLIVKNILMTSSCLRTLILEDYWTHPVPLPFLFCSTSSKTHFNILFLLFFSCYHLQV